MSKGGQGAAAANILLLKKSEESRKQETVIRDAIRVSLINTKKSVLGLSKLLEEAVYNFSKVPTQQGMGVLSAI